MTVGLAIRCSDGVVVATDSLATMGRGVPVARYTNKVHIIEHDALASPVALVGAGMTAFVNKLLERSEKALDDHSSSGEPQLDISDFSEQICESIVAFLFKEYVIDRYAFFGSVVGDFSMSIMVAGARRDGEFRAYYVHQDGVSEAIDSYGTIGSGAAYAELFLRDLLPDRPQVTVDEAGSLAVYAIKGVEIMDPYVGGDTQLRKLYATSKGIRVGTFAKSKLPKKAKSQMERLLNKMGADMRSLLK